MQKLKIITILSTIIALNGCTIPEVYEAHGLRGVFLPPPKINPFVSGQTCELGRSGEAVNYECAYEQYYIAQELGDIRAKPALDALIKKMSATNLEWGEKDLQYTLNNIKSHHETLSDMYEVPKEYNIHYINKSSNQ